MSYTFRGVVMDDEIKASIDRYVEHGVPTGSFLEAVLSNDLYHAVMRADERRLPQIPAIVGYIVNEIPMNCWGTQSVYATWLKLTPEERHAKS